MVYSYSIFETIELAFFMIVRDYLLTGVVIATILWFGLFYLAGVSLLAELFFRFTSNRLLLSPPSHSTPADSRVEWAYAFDVHTNAFFPLYLTLYLAQLFLLPVIFKDNWVCLWVGNTLYLAAYVPLPPYDTPRFDMLETQICSVYLRHLSGTKWQVILHCLVSRGLTLDTDSTAIPRPF